MVVAAIEIVFISLAVYGQSGNFNLAGLADGERGQENSASAHGWWTLILIAVTVVFFVVTVGDLRRHIQILCAGDPDVGSVRDHDGDRREGQDARRPGRPGQRSQQPPRTARSLTLEIDPDQIRYIPANVEAQIDVTTAFGAKFVDLVYPENPSPQIGWLPARYCSRRMSAQRSTPSSKTSSTCST